MSLMRFGHVPERRLAELAEPSGGSAPSERERRHLDSCARCQGLLTGHRRTARLLRGTLISVDARSAGLPSARRPSRSHSSWPSF